MLDPLRIVVSEARFTEPLRSLTAAGGRALEYPPVRPIHRAFRQMIRESSYDVCEMAIGAYLQALDAGHDLLVLPVAMSGAFHHGSLFTSGSVASASELSGGRIGVRAYSQTSGLWVRGWLAEEEGVGSADVTWVVNEDSHVEEFRDPHNVEHTEQPLRELLASRHVDAAILGLSDDVSGLSTMLPNPTERALAWHKRHGCVPINHLLVTTRRVAEHDTEVLAAVYDALASAIDQGLVDKPRNSALPSAVTHGRDRVLPAVELAAKYAHEQGLVAKPVDDLAALFVPGLGT